MSNELATITQTLPAALADLFDIEEYRGDLTDGISGGFPVMSFRGSKWRIKHGGEEALILNADGEAAPSITVVMVKAAKGVSKIYYDSGYTEGDDSPPACFSVDGKRPDASVSEPQHSECASCPHAQWGSRVTDAGKKIKACSDNRRVVVVPAAAGKANADPEILKDKEHGGAALLRIPAASLADLANFGRLLVEQKGVPYNVIVTRIGFDADASYPKLTFKAVRVLTEEELQVVGGILASDTIDNILASGVETESAAPAEKKAPAKTVDTDWEEDDAGEPAPQADPEAEKKAAKAAKAAATKKANAAKTAKAKAKAEKAAEAKAAAEATSGSEEMDTGLDEILGELGELDGLG